MNAKNQTGDRQKKCVEKSFEFVFFFRKSTEWIKIAVLANIFSARRKFFTFVLARPPSTIWWTNFIGLFFFHPLWLLYYFSRSCCVLMYETICVIARPLYQFVIPWCSNRAKFIESPTSLTDDFNLSKIQYVILGMIGGGQGWRWGKWAYVLWCIKNTFLK